ncbi:MAG: restriction endonuclease [Candidatus Thorarchaeota archaeon]
MTIPKFTECMVPLLRYAVDKEEKLFREAWEYLADNEFDLTPEERDMRLKRGQKVMANRVGWAYHELKRAGLLRSTSRGKFRITERGLEVLEKGIEQIDRKYLMQYEGYREYMERSRSKGAVDEQEDVKGPLENLEEGYNMLREATIQDLINKVREISSRAFEHLVVKLILKMGYGVGEDTGVVLGGSGDEGVDGVIWQDALGLDRIYIQAKRWKNPVGDATVTNFEGSLDRKKASKGVLITTSRFTSTAIKRYRGMKCPDKQDAIRRGLDYEKDKDRNRLQEMSHWCEYRSPRLSKVSCNM